MDFYQLSKKGNDFNGQSSNCVKNHRFMRDYARIGAALWKSD